MLGGAGAFFPSTEIEAPIGDIYTSHTAYIDRDVLKGCFEGGFYAQMPFSVARSYAGLGRW